jgi:hypothetical protein
LDSEAGLLEDRTALSYDICSMRRFVSDHASRRQVDDALLATTRRREQHRHGGGGDCGLDPGAQSGFNPARPQVEARTSQHQHIRVLLDKLEAAFRRPLIGTRVANNDTPPGDKGTTAVPPRAPRLVNELKQVFLGLEQQVVEANAREAQASRTLETLIAEEAGQGLADSF